MTNIPKIIDKAIEVQAKVDALEKQKKDLEEEIDRLLSTPLNEK